MVGVMGRTVTTLKILAMRAPMLKAKVAVRTGIMIMEIDLAVT